MPQPSLDHDELNQQYLSLLQTQLSRLQALATQSDMHTSYLSAAVASLLVLSVSAAPATAAVSSSQSSTMVQAHYQFPGSPHGPELHPSGSGSASPDSSDGSSSDDSPDSSDSSASSLHARSTSTSSSSSLHKRDAEPEQRTQDLHNLKDLVLEIRDDSKDWLSRVSNGGNEENTKTGNGGEDSGEDHATYMLGSPVSFPARDGQEGR